MELVEEQQLPKPVELLARVGARHGGEELGVVQRLLAAPVAALDAGLGRVGAAVILEVELALDGRPRAGLCLERLEELGRGMELRARKPLEVVGTAERLEHRRRGTAAAVAVAEHEQAGARVIVIPVVADGPP